ncbi:MAG TPA: cytochrome c3 family protein [bacterium]
MGRAEGCLALLALALLGATTARAAVDGSPHDIIAQGYDAPKAGAARERCLRCHLPASVVDKGLLAELPPVLARQWGPSSAMCFSCHDGTTIVSPDVDASLTAFHPLAHGADLGAAAARREGEAVAGAGEGERLECVACHDPHDNGHRPFLRQDIAEICARCHAAQYELGRGKENVSGNHPVLVEALGGGRREAPLTVSAPFLTPFPTPYPARQGKGTAGVHWQLGGHLSQGAAGQVLCVTCHVVHGDGQGPPRRGLLTVDPVGAVADLFCEGCHAGERGDAQIDSAAKPNPGGTRTGRTYHPCDDDRANGEGRIVEAEVPERWPVGGDQPPRLLCTTCHTAHAAGPGTLLLRPAERAATFCEECHAQVPEGHHAVGGDPGRCPDQTRGVGQEPAQFDCARCHRAHNAGLGAEDERAFIPLLRESRAGDLLCLGCHPADNPTCDPTKVRDGYMASHFRGDPARLDTYNDQDPPERTDPWPESYLPSTYGGTAGKDIVCLSCHSFARGALTSGDEEDQPHLLARVGNRIDWVQNEETKYLCTGCHGVRPGTGSGAKGHTHPLMDADVLKLGLPVQPPASATSASRINCDSCHRSHGAATAGGVYILEEARGTNTDPMAIQPKIDFTLTCHLCHDASKY